MAQFRASNAQKVELWANFKISKLIVMRISEGVLSIAYTNQLQKNKKIKCCVYGKINSINAKKGAHVLGKESFGFGNNSNTFKLTAYDNSVVGIELEQIKKLIISQYGESKIETRGEAQEQYITLNEFAILWPLLYFALLYDRCQR